MKIFSKFLHAYAFVQSTNSLADIMNHIYIICYQRHFYLSIYKTRIGANLKNIFLDNFY